MSAVCLELSGARSRDGLKLQLNRSLSEPGPHTPQHLFLSPPKRCKLESSSVSLPTSPCTESGTLQRALILKKVNIIESDGLKQKLESSRTGHKTFVVIDCRPFISYNMSHISGAININCSDRFNRRRLQQGKVTLADLATSREGKEMLKKRTYKDVIVYDDSTYDKERVTSSHPLLLVLSSLVEDNREPYLLLGEYYFLNSSQTAICLSFYPTTYTICASQF